MIARIEAAYLARQHARHEYARLALRRGRREGDGIVAREPLRHRDIVETAPIGAQVDVVIVGLLPLTARYPGDIDLAPLDEALAPVRGTDFEPHIARLVDNLRGIVPELAGAVLDVEEAVHAPVLAPAVLAYPGTLPAAHTVVPADDEHGMRCLIYTGRRLVASSLVIEEISVDFE